MKFVKGVTIFLVLCFAAFGAFALLKPPPKLSVSESEKDYLQTLGIDVQGGAASESGLSGLFDDIQDDAPAGAATGSFASSAPPSFLAGSTASSVAPSFGESAPLVSAEVPALQSAPVFPAPVLPVPATEVLPPQNFAEPIRAPIQAPLQEAPAFDTAPPFAAPPSVQVQESPPPWKGNWDGPASTLPATPPSSNPLPPLNISPIPTVALPHSVNRQPLTGGENVHRIETESAKPVNTFSPMESVPQETAPPQYTPQYTPTSARQPLTFEPVKPGQSANSPRVAFSSPKRSDSAPQPAFNQVENFPLRSIDRPTGPPSADLSPLRETFEQHMQPLQQLVDSGDPQKIRTAFIQLSQLYEHNQLNESERAMMLPLLDRLALQVIYSRDTHILEPPYRVKPGETVETIAKDCNLNPALLRKINGLSINQQLAAGTILKVVYGQFDAQISTRRKEMTLLLGGLYAGRFAFTCPRTEIAARSGEFFVSHKTDQMVALNNGWTLAAAHSKDATILFSNQDAREIFDILSKQSVIVVE